MRSAETSTGLSGPVYAALAFGLMALGDAAAKALAFRNPPLQLAFLFTISAMGIIGLWTLRQGGAALRPRHPRLMALRALCSVVAGLGGLYAFVQLPLAEAYTILFTAPVIVTALSKRVLGERVGLQRWIAALAGLAGVLIVLRPGFREIAFGHVSALLAAFALAASSLIIRRIGPYESRAAMTLIPMFGGLLVTSLSLPFVYAPMRPLDLGLCVIVGGLIAAGQFMLVNAYRASPASVVAPFHYSQMLWALLLGALLFGDRPDPWLAIGASAVIASGLTLLWLDGRTGRRADDTRRS
jgi:S-adenosylmethionine uptake transporter